MAIIIPFANSKGGQGKTLFSTLVSLEMANRKTRTALVEYEAGEGSPLATMVKDVEAKNGPDHFPECWHYYDFRQYYGNTAELIRQVETLRRDPDLDVILIDSPGIIDLNIGALFQSSDLVVVPVKSASQDRWKTVEFLMSLMRFDITVRVLYTDQPTGALASGTAVDAMKDFKEWEEKHDIPFFKASMAHRHGAYPSAFTNGATPEKLTERPSASLRQAQKELDILVDELVAIVSADEEAREEEMA